MIIQQTWFSACRLTWYYETASGHKTKGTGKVCLESSVVFVSESTLSACKCLSLPGSLHYPTKRFAKKIGSGGWAS